MPPLVINLDQVPGCTSPLHPLNAAVRTFILRQLASSTNNKTDLIILTGGPHHFSAGADLKEFSTSMSNGPSLIDVVNAIEASSVPVVAVIAGTCLGGGLELALACHARMLLLTQSSTNTNTKLGLPEVHVGVLPGAGGTQRLPRLVGLQQALQMILTGVPVTSSKKALSIGLVDAVVEYNNYNNNDNNANFEQFAAQQAHELWTKKTHNTTNNTTADYATSNMPIKESPAQAHVILQAAQLQLPRLGSDGCLAALEAIRAATTSRTFSDGMQIEHELFMRTLVSEQGRARRHAFFAVRQAQKLVVPVSASNSNNDSSIDKHPLLDNNKKNLAKVHVGVVGAGTMGAGIAYVLLQAGYCVHLVDVQPQALERGTTFIKSTIDASLERRQISENKAKDLHARLHSTTSLADLQPCLLVVEAVVENLKLKRSIFKQLDEICTSNDAILVSNTSTLDIDSISSAVDVHKSRVAGWHFFSPAHRMKLVEIIHGSQTSSATVALLQALTKRIGKIGVVVGNCDGFVGNRLLKPYSSEAFTLLTESSNNTVASIDQAILNFGMALGPFQMGDLAGNDVAYNIRIERGWAKRNSNDTNIPPNRPPRYSELADIMVTDYNRLGQKAGKGWYDYNPAIGKGRVPLESKEMNTLVAKYSLSSSNTPLSEQEVVERVFFPMVNEGFKCLEEGIARCPSDIDVVYLYGYGWPMYKGGPMYWADQIIGLPTLLAKLKQFAAQFPDTEHYVPSKLLEKCVAMKVTVQEYYEKGMSKSQSRL